MPRKTIVRSKPATHAPLVTALRDQLADSLRGAGGRPSARVAASIVKKAELLAKVKPDAAAAIEGLLDNLLADHLGFARRRRAGAR